MGSLTRANADLQKQLRAELERIRTEYETTIHSELRSVRQKAFAAATLPAVSAPKTEQQYPYDFLRFAERHRYGGACLRYNLRGSELRGLAPKACRERRG